MDLNIENYYTQNADFIFKYAKEQNDKGKVFPLYGICLGHQLLSYLTSGYDYDVIQLVDGEHPTVNTINFKSKNAYILQKWTD